ncbi:hypothetical protein CRENBAI_001172 [Crenichthys baileyi]|uniref:Uncharacterized protein n=1 Tax=Crenichthys baileyi TaxID=28760 RepID=A0AAV9RH02_9TELE
MCAIGQLDGISPLWEDFMVGHPFWRTSPEGLPGSQTGSLLSGFYYSLWGPSVSLPRAPLILHPACSSVHSSAVTAHSSVCPPSYTDSFKYIRFGQHREPKQNKGLEKQPEDRQSKVWTSNNRNHSFRGCCQKDPVLDYSSWLCLLPSW